MAKFGSNFGLTWLQHGPIWEQFRPKLDSNYTMLLPCRADMPNAQLPQRGTDFWRCKHGAPPLKPYQPNKCVRNLKSHVSAPSVRADLKDPSTVLNWLRTGICLPSYKWCVCVYIYIYIPGTLDLFVGLKTVSAYSAGDIPQYTIDHKTITYGTGDERLFGCWL